MFILNKLNDEKAHAFESLHMESSPEAYAFYKKAGYQEMPFNDPEGYEKDPRDVEMGKVLRS